MEFNYTNSINDTQNKLIGQSIRDVSNLGLLKSEEAIMAVIKSYKDRFNTIEGHLTKASEYVVKSREVVKVDKFNNLFESIYIDLSALYTELELVDTVLNLNLYRNKNYLSVIKKRISHLWTRLNLARLSIYDSNPASEAYHESFNTQFNLVDYNNITVDRRFGFVHLNPIKKILHNDAVQIKTITSETYPVHNEEGGVFHTTNVLNTFKENYENGSKDMLKNGLWKEEVLAINIPDMVVNIGDTDVPIWRSYSGVVSKVDIEFASSTPINRFDFDLFGELATKIDQILYKTNKDDTWQIVKYESDDLLDTENSTYSYNKVAQLSSYDIINFINLIPFNAKYLRIIFVKENYNLVDSVALNNDMTNDAVYNDFSERRYEVLRFGTHIDDKLSVPTNDENMSLYSQIVSIIESTKDLDRTLNKINLLLNPKINLTTVDFNRLIKYELGTWSIEPFEETYSNLPGTFKSIDYKIMDKSLLSVSLFASSTVPKTSTCNWYIGVGNQEVPIIENNISWRKERANIVNLSNVAQFGSFPGAFILLDFPVDAALAEGISVYHEDRLITDCISKISFFNSRLIYINDLIFTNANIVIRYPVDTYSTVNVYTLYSNTIDTYMLGIVASRKNALQYLLNVHPSLKDKYVINSAYASKSECRGWFGANFDQSIFCDASLNIISELASQEWAYSKLRNSILEGVSKLHSEHSDVVNFVNTGSSNFTYDITSDDINICPLISKRVL
jgi:hypothetical protein